MYFLVILVIFFFIVIHGFVFPIMVFVIFMLINMWSFMCVICHVLNERDFTMLPGICLWGLLYFIYLLLFKVWGCLLPLLLLLFVSYLNFFSAGLLPLVLLSFLSLRFTVQTFFSHFSLPRASSSSLLMIILWGQANFSYFDVSWCPLPAPPPPSVMHSSSWLLTTFFLIPAVLTMDISFQGATEFTRTSFNPPVLTKISTLFLATQLCMCLGGFFSVLYYCFAFKLFPIL